MTEQRFMVTDNGLYLDGKPASSYSPKHVITTSGYAGYWTASCECGWVGVAHRSMGAFNAEPRAKEEGKKHVQTIGETNNG